MTETAVNTPFEPDPTRYATEHGNREAPMIPLDGFKLSDRFREALADAAAEPTAPKTRASGVDVSVNILPIHAARAQHIVENWDKVLKPAKPARKKSSISPTQRSLKHMRELGYLCAVVEKWNMHAKIRQDLYGFIDVLCVKGEDIVGVQSTSGDNVASRVTKITEHENWPLVCAAIRVIVHGWRKNAAGKWALREVEL